MQAAIVGDVYISTCVHMYLMLQTCIDCIEMYVPRYFTPGLDFPPNFSPTEVGSFELSKSFLPFFPFFLFLSLSLCSFECLEYLEYLSSNSPNFQF
jgi:hypothetical protein